MRKLANETEQKMNFDTLWQGKKMEKQKRDGGVQAKLFCTDMGRKQKREVGIQILD